jgi:hypothetical protein
VQRQRNACVQVLPLTEYVFNTEAHPLPIVGSAVEQAHREWYLQQGQCPLDVDPQTVQTDDDDLGDPRLHKDRLEAALTWLGRWNS